APLEVTMGLEARGSAARHELTVGVSIEGSVVDERSGRHVAGATVWLGSWPLARSGQSGAFEIRHAPSNWSSLVARTEGQVGSAKRSSGKLVVRLQPLHVLSGVVRDSRSGAPLAGAVVTAQGERSATAISGSDGRYTFSVLPERYSVSA